MSTTNWYENAHTCTAHLYCSHLLTLVRECSDFTTRAAQELLNCGESILCSLCSISSDDPQCCSSERDLLRYGLSVILNCYFEAVWLLWSRQHTSVPFDILFCDVTSRVCCHFSKVNLTKSFQMVCCVALWYYLLVLKVLSSPDVVTADGGIS